MSFACAEHPHHLGVGVCASCVREKLLHCIRSLKEQQEGEEAPPSTRIDGSSYSFYSSPSAYHEEANKGFSSEGNNIVQGGGHTRTTSFSSSHHYDAPRSSDYGLCEKEGRPFSSLLAKVFVKRAAPRRTNPRRTVLQYYHGRSSPASLTWETPRPSTSSKPPLKFASAVCSPTPSSHLRSSQLSRSPLLRHNQPTISCSPLQLPPLISSLPASQSPLSLPSPLRHPRSARPTIASTHASSRTHLAPSADEANWRSGQRVSGVVRTKRKAVWLLFMLRKLRIFRFRRRVERQEEEVESVQAAADSNRPSSATDSDFYVHSHNSDYSWKQARHSQQAYNSYSDTQISASFNRSQRERREDSKTIPRGTNSSSCRYYGASTGFDSYYNSGPVQSNFNGLQARHRSYNSISCMHRRENAELLRFYLTPPSF